MKKTENRVRARRRSLPYSYSSEGPYWLSIRLNAMRGTLEARRGSTFGRDALIRNGRRVVKAVREYLAAQGEAMAPKLRSRLANSLARYEAEAS